MPCFYAFAIPKSSATIGNRILERMRESKNWLSLSAPSHDPDKLDAVRFRDCSLSPFPAMQRDPVVFDQNTAGMQAISLR